MDIGRLRDRALQSLPGRLALKFGEDQAPNWAVVIAWNALTSMFPILLVIVGVLGLVLGQVGVNASTVYGTVLSLIPSDPQAQRETLKALETVKHTSWLFFVIGFVGLVWSGSGLFGAMEQAFAVMYHTQPRDFVRQKLMAVLMMALFTVLAGGMLLTSTLLGLIEKLPFLPHAVVANPAVTYAAQIGLGFVAGVVLFMAIYSVVPNRKQELRTVWPGALLAGAAFELLTLVFPLYVHYAGSANQYGKTFGFLFLVLSLAYFVGLITMVGVELNSILYPVPVEQPEPVTALDAPKAARPAAAGTIAATPPDPGYGRRLLLPARRRIRWVKAAVGLLAVGAASVFGKWRERGRTA
jgi:membrane protein